MIQIYNLFFILTLVLWGNFSSAALCQSWSTATEVGSIPSDPITEQSGLAVSKKYSRFYHVNDSGDGPKIYVTDMTGKLLFTTTYSNAFPLDVEDMSYAKCHNREDKYCLVVGDIGDNFGFRPQVYFHFVEEQLNWPEKVPSIRSLQVRYPDGKHDAESFDIHPNGDLIILSKSYSGKKALVSSLYRLEAEKVQAGGTHTLTKIGELDIPSMVKSSQGTNVATSMSISPDGSKFLVLTYKDVIEVNFDLSKKTFPALLKKDVDFQIVKIKPLAQMEALSYSGDGLSFYYSSEAKRQKFVLPDSTPLMQVRCVSK